MKKKSKLGLIFQGLFSGKKGQAGSAQGGNMAGSVFSFIAILVWLLDMSSIFGEGYGGFNLDPQEFFKNWLMKFTFGNVWFDTFLIIMIVYFVVYFTRHHEVPGFRIFTVGLFTATMIFFIANAGAWVTSTKAIIHFIFILLFGFVYLSQRIDWDGAFVIISLLLISDFFLYSPLLRFMPFFRYLSLLGTIVIILTFALSPSLVTSFCFIAVVILMIILTIADGRPVDGTFIFQNDEIGMAPLNKFMGKVSKGIAFYISGFKTGLQRQMEYASGGYYRGKVEENVREPLGVYLENLQLAEPVFYEDEEAILWGTLLARTLDEEEPVSVSLSCYADRDMDAEPKKQGQPGEIKPKLNFRIETYDEEDFSCKFGKNKLTAGSHEVKFLAEFNFPTMAYLKTYFMDNERRRSMMRDGINILENYGIEDENPVAVYTNGPVRIGSELAKMASQEASKILPIGVYDDKMVVLGITIENQWQGMIKKIKTFELEVPQGMEVSVCEGVTAGTGTKTDDGFMKYTLTPREKKFKDIKTFNSLRCSLRVTDIKILLGDTPITTGYYRITVTYDYELESNIDVDIKRYLITATTPEIEKMRADKDIPGKLTGELKNKILSTASSLSVAIPPHTLLGLVEQESGFDQEQVSKEETRNGMTYGGCVGLFQICSWTICRDNGMPHLTGKNDLKGSSNLDDNIKCGLIILKQKYDECSKGLRYSCSPRETSVLYTGWDAALRCYNTKECEGANVYFVEEVNARAEKYKG